jgi:hypothetical protein
MEPIYRRSRLWIDPPFQTRLLLRVGCYILGFTVCVWHISFALEAMRDAISTGPSHSLAELYVDYFWKQLPLLYTFVLIVPFLLYNLLKFSHRIAGPLYRCRKVMDEMASGKAVHEFRPRRYDLMGELFASFNGLIRQWNARIDAEQAQTGNGESSPRNGVAAGSHHVTR